LPKSRYIRCFFVVPVVDDVVAPVVAVVESQEVSSCPWLNLGKILTIPLKATIS